MGKKNIFIGQDFLHFERDEIDGSSNNGVEVGASYIRKGYYKRMILVHAFNNHSMTLFEREGLKIGRGRIKSKQTEVFPMWYYLFFLRKQFLRLVECVSAKPISINDNSNN